ncbi:hypothetical protein CORMATOL_01912 [Corynebacterium matruchotii ATCC 33806]|uniref:Uncharacterized protein n=1 Tax=Corynebacterium matruchotii ATCC 33806 TaxID=566549 RepID=C0E4I7_9CORY|nr:hypothetical protein CORMATOL_01912 [Corynebacterium matruchotii ATCC 33806]
MTPFLMAIFPRKLVAGVKKRGVGGEIWPWSSGQFPERGHNGAQETFCFNYEE